MKMTIKFIFVFAMMVGFTTNSFSQRKQVTLKVKKHKPVTKIVYTKAPKKIIKPAIGTIVYQLTNNAKQIVLNRSRYMKQDNVLYTKIKIRGKHAYKVVRYS